VSEGASELVRRQFEDLFNKQNFDLCEEVFAERYIEHAVAPFQDSEPGAVNGTRSRAASGAVASVSGSPTCR
jgi:hypothetical protein